jgi:Fur family transcriptional regulator, peroxide stress response regulator
MKNEINRDILIKFKLKVTPQRLAVLEVFSKTRSHPTAEKIVESVQKNHHNIAVGTVYLILDTLCKKGIIQKVKTERDIMRYDSVSERHHHLYCAESNRIEDYIDDDLNEILSRYFKEKKIPDFIIENITLQIQGKFIKNSEG